jgi:hypothetical protein
MLQADDSRNFTYKKYTDILTNAGIKKDLMFTSVDSGIRRNDGFVGQQ